MGIKVNSLVKYLFLMSRIDSFVKLLFSLPDDGGILWRGQRQKEQWRVRGEGMVVVVGVVVPLP